MSGLKFLTFAFLSVVLRLFFSVLMDRARYLLINFQTSHEVGSSNKGFAGYAVIDTLSAHAIRLNATTFGKRAGA